MENNGTEAKANGGRDENGLTPAQRTWLDHIRQCETEGMTFAAYCSREGLPVSGLYAARKTLREKGTVARDGKRRRGSPPRFAAVRLAHRDDVGTVEVLCPDGVQMRITLHDVDRVVRAPTSIAS